MLVEHLYLPWDTGHRWPVWPEKKDVDYTKFYNDTTTGRRNGATEAKPTTLVVPEIKRVIFNGPATIVFWSDSTKTVVKCMEGELFDEEKGIAMAFMKKLYGDGYMRKIRKHIPAHAFVEEEENVER